MTTDYMMGWDIGGAHLKAAIVNRQGIILQILQAPCPLWKGLQELEHAVQDIMVQVNVNVKQHAITMTGELVDLFSSREEGVRMIIATMHRSLAEQDMQVFAAPDQFIQSQRVSTQHYAHIASANWLASIAYVASKVENALFIDIGSTTTDILVIADAAVQVQGLTDYERLCSAELLYTGIVRTPVMAITGQVFFEQQHVGLMAEHFATMADVYRLTGELNEQHDQADTADGGVKTPLASALRLSRMIGCDFNATQLSRWQAFAQVLRSHQLQNIEQACSRVMADTEYKKPPLIVGAGIGRFLAEQMAQQWGYAYQDFSQLFTSNTATESLSAADCAPAVAVACLACKVYN